jgi:two-component system chemotaxis sensor kinase CheA
VKGDGVDKDQLIKRLMTTFLEELHENVGALNRDLLALEKDATAAGRAARFKTLFRTVHSLKGAARSVSVGLIESACHRLEEILAAARDGRVPIGPDLMALLFATADAIEEAGMRLREQQDLTGAPLAALLPRLEAAAGEAARRPPSSAPAAEPAEPAQGAAAVVAPEPVWAAELPPEPAAVVRVPAEKLDSLFAQSGELLVVRQRVQSRVADVLALRESVGQWMHEWRAVEKQLAKILSKQERKATEQGDSPVALPLLPRQAGLALGRAADHLRGLEKDLEQLAAAMAGDGRALKESADALDAEVRRVRMLPFAQACQGLDRMARDLARAGGKDVDLLLEGGDVEMDRSILEGLKDPLRHLVRNAVDHGAESADQRRSAGKPPRARVTVAASLRGSQVEVVVTDDGRGLDLDAVREQARRRKLAEPADERELARLIFLPGFSTAPLLTDVSGRGIGLDVVKSRVEGLHGTIDLASEAGRGTRFTLSVPLTLTTLRALLVAAGGQTFALADTNVRKLVRINPAEVRSVEGRPMLALGGTPLPLASLAATLGLPAHEPVGRVAKAPAVIVTAGEKRMAFVVDEFLAEQEIVVKGLGTRVRRLRHVAGATILASGRIALVLNAANLVRTALSRAPALAPAQDQATAKPKKRVLVVDDSVTTRTLEKSILEAAGYEVTVAPDGTAAWVLLQERGTDLLVSDVDMPRMDGFALTEAVRGSKRFRDLPVVLVSARETEQDRARGIAVGADAYLGKSAFDQKYLLETIAQLL